LAVNEFWHVLVNEPHSPPPSLGIAERIKRCRGYMDSLLQKNIGVVVQHMSPVYKNMNLLYCFPGRCGALSVNKTPEIDYKAA